MFGSWSAAIGPLGLQGKKYDPSDLEVALLPISGLRPGCFAAFGVEDRSLGSERLVVVSEVVTPAPARLEELVEEVRQRVAVELDASVSDEVLLPRGAMTKTSSGKRRHRFYSELYSRGELDPLAQLAPGRSGGG